MNQKASLADPTDRVMQTPAQSPRHEEALLDESVAESFPASDPIAPAVAARMEPADVQRENVADGSVRLAELMRRNAPTLLALGAAAAVLVALRALRRDRDSYDD
jgi:hypothetical protein